MVVVVGIGERLIAAARVKSSTAAWLDRFSSGGEDFDCTYKAQEPKPLTISCFKMSERSGRVKLVDTSNARNTLPSETPILLL